MSAATRAMAELHRLRRALDRSAVTLAQRDAVIRSARTEGVRAADIAEALGLSRQTVYNALGKRAR